MAELFKILLFSFVKPVVNVVDRVSWLDDGIIAHEFTRLMVFWMNIVENLRVLNFDSKGPVLKILLTHPGVSIYAEQWFATCRWRIIDMTECSFEGDDGSGDSTGFKDHRY
ncbi:hypothetical protein F5Y16DRAFT_344828 [Xylariaceae sp. FL0255]|nr:hypothetical protein F5Y16DRAFT_344828 [Xylariaceae sp. FL0255]